MYINGKLTIFTKEVTKKDGSKTILLNSFLSTKDAKGKEYRVYKPVLIKKDSNTKRDNFKVGNVYHVELDNDNSNSLMLTEYNGETKEIIYLGNFKITGEFPVKNK